MIDLREGSLLVGKVGEGKRGDIGHCVIVGGRWVPQEGARGRDYHRNSESVPDPEWFMQLDMQSGHATTLHFYLHHCLPWK